LPTAPMIAEKYDQWLVIQNRNAPTQVGLELQHEFEVFDQPRRIQFSEQGEYVAVACYQHRSVQVYSVESGEVVGTYFHTQNDEILSSDPGSILAVPLQIDGLVMRFSLDAQNLITTAIDLVIRIWDIGKGRVMRRFKGHTENITSLAISADGNYLAAGSGKKFLLWNLKAEDKYRSGRDVDVATINIDVATKGIEFSPDSKLLAVKGDSDYIYLLGGKDWKQLERLYAENLHGRGTRKALRFSRDGATLTWASHKKVYQWRLNYSGTDEILDRDSPVASEESFEFGSLSSDSFMGYNCSTEWVLLTRNASDLALYKFHDKQPRLTLCNSNGFIGELH
jgi:WD40 repeat protein